MRIGTAASVPFIGLCLCLSAGPVRAWGGDAPVTEQEPKKTLDDVFREALYFYATLDVARAYELLDEGISGLPPTQDSHRHLFLYKMCFNLKNDNFGAWAEHSDKAKAEINELQKKADKSDTDFVKLATLLPKAGEFRSDIPALEELLKAHPDSPWAEWAKWTLVEYRAVKLPAGNSKAFPFRTYYHNRILSDGMAAELREQKKTSSDSIMTRYLLRRLSSFARTDAQRLKEYYEAVAAFAPDDLKEARIDTEVQQIRDAFVKLRASFATVEDRKLAGVKTTKGLWSYYQELRNAGVRLPDTIPTDKKVFLGKVKSFLEVESILHERWLKEDDADEEP
ncbi:MAG: hypothetical protein HQ592_07070 [Planctomycetes bacterium]|nr:hypothetical protein [Planctomycetota bacterium]